MLRLETLFLLFRDFVDFEPGEPSNFEVTLELSTVLRDFDERLLLIDSLLFFFLVLFVEIGAVGSCGQFRTIITTTMMIVS